MRTRPRAVAFDVVQTLMSLEPLRARLGEVGLPGSMLEHWFDRILRNGMALAGPSLTNWIIAGAGDGVRGRAVGMLTTGLFAGQFFSPVLTQPVIDAAGLRPTFLGIAVASALTALGYAALARHKA